MAIAAGALVAASASLAQVKPATPAPPTRAAPAPPRRNTPTTEQNVRQPAHPPVQDAVPTAPSAKPAPQATQPPGVGALPPPQTPPPVDTSQPPPSLPRASRQKMRACAEEWDRMKRESISGLPTWRDFATQCLTR
ncbi:MAG: hypothetical protein FJX45_07605 [Alphaproteobacteria bacterium]|nr:hypothetical protein [Alphaproteobacteria bacterium]MBM3653199.1 hypothetical protein [Alphaproteobacteria bacterium]